MSLRSELSKYKLNQIGITSHALNRAKERIKLNESDMIAEIELKNIIIKAIKHNDLYQNGSKIYLNSQIRNKKNKELEFVMENNNNKLTVITIKPTSASAKLSSIG